MYKSLRRKRPESLKDLTLVGQSVYYDLNFLKIGYNRLNLDWLFSNKLIDLYSITYVMEQALKANKLPTPKSLGLGAVASYFGFEREDSVHNALEDAKLTAACIKGWMQMSAGMKINP